jgi:hypothetical protein
LGFQIFKFIIELKVDLQGVGLRIRGLAFKGWVKFEKVKKHGET